MVHNIFAGLSLLAMLAYCSVAQNCNPHPIADANQCSYSNRNSGPYRDMDVLLNDALQNEHIPDFVVNITLGMYRYIHPCQDVQTAILFLFYNIPVSGSGGAIGRRRRDGDSHHNSHSGGNHDSSSASRAHYNNEIALLTHQLDAVVQDTGRDTGCIQYLIDKYLSAAADVFKQMNPQYHTPAATQPPSTSTTTTPMPSTSTTTQLPSTTLVPAAQCTDCTGLNCLLTKNVISCPAGQDYCLITVEDNNGRRTITRGCTSQAKCDAISRDPQCSSVETASINTALTCEFCCKGNNCNEPPSLMPVSGSYP